MAYDIYSPQAMGAVLPSLIAPKLGLLDTFFTTEQTEETEEIHFDIEVKKRKIAPFVHPSMQGKIVENEGFETATFRPAYVKPKTMLRPKDALKRAIGESITPQLSASERRAALLASTLLDHKEQILRRMNLMAAEALVDGRVTVKGEGYGTKVVNFGRDSSLSIVLSGAAKWTEATATPIDDIEAAIERVHLLEGADVDTIIMDPVAAKYFRRNKQVTDILDIRRAAGSPTAELGGLGNASSTNGLKLVGNFGSFTVWSYSEYYLDDDGVVKPVLAPGTVIGGSAAVQGLRAYGAIQDEEAGIQAVPMFAKSWLNPDPSGRFVMTQSACMVVTQRPNGAFSIKVL